MKLLVLAAWEPELTHFRGLARGMAEVEIAFDVAGVGLVESAIGTTHALARHAPTHALLVGTCGAVANDLRICDAVVGASVVLAARDGDLPDTMPSTGTFDEDLRSLFRARAVAIASTLGITTDDEAARRLRARGEVEHLEAFAFFRACSDATVPCAAVFAIANTVGSRGREEWLANHEAASARAADVAFEGIKNSTRARSPA